MRTRRNNSIFTPKSRFAYPQRRREFSKSQTRTLCTTIYFFAIKTTSEISLNFIIPRAFFLCSSSNLDFLHSKDFKWSKTSRLRQYPASISPQISFFFGPAVKANHARTHYRGVWAMCQISMRTLYSQSRRVRTQHDPAVGPTADEDEKKSSILYLYNRELS